jgi:outer membrane protein TolC
MAAFLLAVIVILLTVLSGAGPAKAGDEVEAEQDPQEVREWTLEECLDTALQNNRRRPASQFAVATAEAQHRQALSGYWPQLHLKGGFQRVDESPNFLFPASDMSVELELGTLEAAAQAKRLPGGQTSSVRDAEKAAASALTVPVPEQNIELMDPNSFLASINLVWLLWDGGMRKGYREQAKGQIEMSKHEARRTDLEIVDTVKRYYYGAVVARQLREVGTLTLERMEATLDLTETMYKEGAGTVTKADYLDNKIMVESIRSMVAMLEKNEAMAQAALANSMGLAWSESARPSAEEVPFEPFDARLEEMVGAAYEFNPDWGKLQGGLRALDGAVRTAKSGHFPKIALTGDLHKWWNDFDSGLATSENKTGWTVGIMMEVPIFNGFLTHSQVAEAKARWNETNEKKFLLREGIGLWIKDILLGLDAAQKQYQATLDAMTAAEENRDLNTRAYQNGLVETEDVIRAQLVEALMQVQHYKMLYDHITLRSRLDLVVGTEVTRLLEQGL